MHLNSIRAANHQMASLLARQASKAGPRLVAAAVTEQKSQLSSYCPIYCLSSSKLQDADASNWRQTKRWANTTSGFFAPSTMVSSQIGNNRQPRGNLSVFDDSDHLASLPVPNLNETLERLKVSISPVAMNSTEFVQALQLIDEFGKSAGPKLDLLLRNKADQTKNWMTHDWWTEETYLRSRQPLVINSNPAMIYPKFPFEANNQRSLVSVVSQLISGIIDFKLSLLHGYNPEATSSDNESRLDPNLCYHQYQNIFGSTRLPGDQIDSQLVRRLSSGAATRFSSSDETVNLEHQTPFNIVVSFKGKFFELQLRDIEDEKDRIDNLSGILDKIIGTITTTTGANINDNVGQPVHCEGAGVLTTANRDEWAKAFRLLDSDSMNALQEAQFVVCLDTIPSNESEQDPFLGPLLTYPAGSDAHSAALARQILHGDQVNVGNRWFDKSFQLIVVADEQAERFLGAGINYEHSFGEATMITKMIEHSFDKTVQKQRDLAGSNFFARQEISTKEPAVFRQLPMFDSANISLIMGRLSEARQDFHAQVSQFDLSLLNYRHYGSNSIKSWRFSPDSWFQVALQSAYYNLHKRLSPCYESASTRRFAYGRTEAIRSLTQDVANFCFNPRFETMQAAIQSHKAYSLAANNASAIDRALMGYRMTYKEIKSNTWSWGLQTLRDGGDSSTTGAFASTGSSEQRVIDVKNLFTDQELSTIGSFFNNELINRSTKFALSTSQVSSIHPNICMSFGPMLADGYGVCYNITGQQVAAAITANSSNQAFSCKVDKLNEHVKESLDNMRQIVEEQQKRSKK